MIKEAIYHIVDFPYAYAIAEDKWKVRLRTKKNDIKECHLIYSDRYDFPFGRDESIMMEKIDFDMMFDYFEVVIDIPSKRPRYKFYLEDQNGEGIWYGEDGFTRDSKLFDFFQMPYICEQDIFKIPEWCKSAIVYQIFPQSFYNGDVTNDPYGVTPWEELPGRDTFYGGDLQGIIDKVDYLTELGINTIYLTPIFKAASPHKYDTIDYMDIDPNFGDMETFKKMVEVCHANGIKVILDAVFTFCGYEFFAFQDVVKNGENSKYLDWFNVYDFPITKEPANYETFVNNIWKLPKIYKNNSEARDYLLEVSRFWIEEAGIDGWRLDTANEVEHEFWKDFRKVVKKANSEAVIIGEVWHRAGPWLRGDEFDSVMNYKFQGPVLEFFAKESIDVETFDSKLTKARMDYPEMANYAGFNLLDSHDTERFLSQCSQRKDRMRLAVLFQLTYLGQPMIYYGDEVGMTGKGDPDNRRPMIWDESKQDKEMFKYYKKLIEIRKEQRALTHGIFKTWCINRKDNVYGFIRAFEEEKVGVLLNNGAKERTITLKTDDLNKSKKEYKDLLSNTVYKNNEGEITINLEPYSGVIIV